MSDNGVGIELHNQTKLWDFTKIQTKKGTEQEKGTGFGLLLCKEFVEKHNGKIWAKKGNKNGATFVFKLPFN